ncbi:MAG: hypothetical protein GQ525_03530 [Draconibacterium sp.]|nr:hypothetical protein [Draconibacterium sp.]
MKSKIELKLLNKELELILHSPQFINSDKEKKLLEYLIKKTLAKEFIKEAHIAIDVFRKEDNFDPSLDSTVRVYMSKVRKKLENFYLSEESNSASYRISIPKGHYFVNFEKRSKKLKMNRLKYLAGILIIISITLLILLTFHLINDRNNLFRNSKSVAKSPVWREYTNSNLPTLIVVGDFFFMSKEINNKRYFIRDAKINSTEDYIQNQMDTLGFDELRNTYSLSDMSVCVSNFIPHLINNKEIFKIKRSSILTWEDINSNNIIFIGDFKTLYILNRLLPQFNIEYDLDKRTYFLLDENSDPINEFDFIRDSDGFWNENIVVSKRPGGNNNTITLIMALGRGGIDDVTQKLCNPDFLKSFLKTYQKGNSKLPFFFDTVFEIEGMEGTSFKSEVVYFNQVSP